MTNIAARSVGGGRDRPLERELRRATPLLVVIPAMIVVMWGVGVLVIHSRVNGWDLRFDRFLVEHRTAWLDVATEKATWLAEAATVISLALVAVVVARIRTGNWRAPLYIALTVGGEKLVYLATSSLVRRGRPPVPTIGNVYATSSFPSGHIGSTICLYGSIAVVLGAWFGRRYLLALLAMTVTFAGVVGFSRMYTGFHYPSDVAAGVIVGTTWICVTTRVLRPIRLDERHSPAARR